MNGLNGFFKFFNPFVSVWDFFLLGNKFKVDFLSKLVLNAYKLSEIVDFFRISHKRNVKLMFLLEKCSKLSYFTMLYVIIFRLS